MSEKPIRQTDSPMLGARWMDFYNKIKDQSWPEIKTQQDFLDLPHSIIKKILFEHVLIDHVDPDGDHNDLDKNIVNYSSIEKIKKHNLEYLTEYPKLDFDLVHKADKINVHYHRNLNGGGMILVKKYSILLEKLYGRKIFGNCLEWCSGPGFIGFELLSRGICENLYLHDIYPPAIKSIKTTIDRNKDLCRDRVFYHHSSSISTFPRNWKFDLVVANPPFFNPDVDQLLSKRATHQNNRMGIDQGWEIHQNFYKNIKNYLSPDGIILIAEAANASGPDTFRPMIEENGLYINDCYWFDFRYPRFYFIEIKIKS